MFNIDNDEENLLLLEGSLTLTTLIEGLDALKNANIYQKGLFYQAFFSLSTGIERLLKLICIYKYKEENGKLPTNAILKDKGHSIYKMVEEILPNILKDELIRNIMQFMNDFAEGSRYYNLDSLTNGSKKYNDPLKEWYKIETQIMEYYNIKIEKSPNQQVLSQMLNQIMDIQYVGLNGKNINSSSTLIDEVNNREKIQSYGVYAMYMIIKEIADDLRNIELKNNFYPCLREFFDYFTGSVEKKEILRRKNWKQIIVG